MSRMSQSVSTVGKGTQLEREVAEFYRQLDEVGRVEENIELENCQIDVYVELTTRDGVGTRYAIDAKNHERPLDVTYVRKCANDFQYLRNANVIDRGIIVSEKGFTKGAKGAAFSAGVVTMRMSELRAKGLGFTQYLKSWVGNYENTNLSKMGMYVPLCAALDGKGIGRLDNYLLRWLREEGRLITMLGDCGSGKSTTLERITYLQAKRYMGNPASERVPVFIRLQGFHSAPNVRSLVTDVIVNEYRIDRLNYEKFREQNQKGRFLIILDGFDEMEDRVTEGLSSRYFQELYALAPEGSKVILSSRTHFFKDHAEVMNLQAEAPRLPGDDSKSSGFQLVTLDRFRDEDIDRLLERRFGDRWRTYKEMIDRTYDLASLAHVPILLNMMMETLPELARQESVTRSSIYRVFADKWLNREAGRGVLGTRERAAFCKLLALRFYRSQTNSVHWRDLPEFLRKQFGTQIQSLSDEDIFSSDVRTSNMLRRDDGGRYSFVHRSFMEYFVAEHFAEQVRERKVNGLDDLRRDPGSLVVWEFLVELLEPECVEFLRQDAFTVEKIDDYSVLMKRKETGSERVYTSSASVGNCAILLIRKGIAVTGAHLDGADLSGVALDGVSFQRAVLRGCKLRQARLSGVQFDGAVLYGASFEGARLGSITFDNANLSHADFLGADIDQVTLESLAKSRHWGDIKIAEIYRRKIRSAYEKAGPVTAYSSSGEGGRDA